MSNQAISKADPQALEKLQTKLESCEKMQEKMKSVNTYYRKHGTCVGHPELDRGQAVRLDEKVKEAYSWDKQPYPSYILTGNSAEIRRIKKRIEEISRDRELGFVGWKFEGGEAVVNEELCRLQLFFDEKPDDKTCNVLNQSGFHWSHRNGAWQRLLNRNTFYACNRIECIKPLDGKRPSELQANEKAVERDERSC